MARWDRASAVCYCGACGAAIIANEPRFVLTPSTERHCRREFYRCQTCAGESVPDDIPAFSEPDNPLLRFDFSKHIRDGKLAAIRED